MRDAMDKQRRAGPLARALRVCRRTFLAAALFSLFANLLILTVPLYMLQVYDRVLASRSVDTLIYLTLLALGALAAVSLLDLVRGRLLIKAGMWLEARLAPAVFERAVEARLRGRARGPEAAADLAQLRAFISGPGILVLFDAPWVPLFLAAAYLFHPIVGHLAVAAAVSLFALAALTDAVTRAPLRAAHEAGIVAFRELDTHGRNAEAIEAMGMMGGLARRWLARNGQILRLHAGAANHAALILSISKLCRLAIQILALAVGCWLVLERELTAGAMIASAIILTRALAPVEQAVGTWKQIGAARAAAQRLGAFLAEPPFHTPAMPLPAPRGALRVEEVAYVLPGLRRPILRSISFALQAGEAMALIGPSAAGKSTLARLLVGVMPPSAGHVRLDGADIFPWNRDELGRHIGYLPQDVELFAGTVRENIARLADGDPVAVVDAAKMADCHEMILSLPNGYDTEIGEAGTHLSGGQRQRIALARALFGHPCLVILDEPNANLDNEGEAALKRALAALKAAGATVVVITHRPPLVEHVDKILLLREGTIERLGAREDVVVYLMPRGGPRPPERPSAALITLPGD